MTWRQRLAEQGPAFAVAGVLIALAVAAVELRMAEEWRPGMFFLFSLLPGAVVFQAGLLAARDGDRPSGSATALLVSGLVILGMAIGALAALLGGDDGTGTGTVAVALFAFAAMAAYPAVRHSSPVSALIAATAFGIAVLVAVESLFDPANADAFRWGAVVLAVAWVALAARIPDRHMSVQLINAAGIAILALVTSLLGELWVVNFAASEVSYAGQTGWEIASMLGGMGLVAYSVLRREPCPGYLGAATLFFFLVAAVGPNRDASLVGWPLVLVALAGVAVAVALLRPRAV